MKLTANPAWLSLPPHRGKESGAQFLRIMKLTTIIILAACLHTSAKGVAQQTITFSGKEVSLESVFTAIKKQTNYRFFFNTDMLKNASKVTIDVKNVQIEQVMNMALKDQPLTFTIKGRTIFVMRKVEEEKKSVQVERTGDPITVSGRVTDENGEPLVGANVKVKGSSNGITTDNQGRFTLSGVDPNASLEVSFVGRETQILSVKGKSVFSVALGQKIGALDETVVIAYGTTTKRFNTGNVSSVKASDIEKQPVQNPLLALQGRVPGIIVTQSTGLPGSGITVRIQGQNSIGKGNDPLYVIDGVPYSSQLLPTNFGGILGTSGGGVAGGGINGNPFSYINPNDIESIDVLKDADATAIYGSRAANGAILITTKKGKAGKTRTDINLKKGWGNVTRKLDLLNSSQYLEMRREAKLNDNAAITATNYDLNGVWDTSYNTDWQKELIGNTSNYSDVQVNVSGGNATTTFFIGSGYHKETTVFLGDFSDRKGSLHFNITNTSQNQR
jgi:TonB-dependent SusC/RagA subfamily outer membrane receptor